MRKIPVLTAALLACLALPAFSAGDPPAPATIAPRNPDYESGRTAVQAQNWKAALDSFNRALAREPNNADIHNYLGYSRRQSGNLDLAFKHYNEALRLDPRHKGAHEYIGEAYLMINNVPKAEEHLAQLDKLCFFSCGEYRDLKKAIEQYKSAKR